MAVRDGSSNFPKAAQYCYLWAGTNLILHLNAPECIKNIEELCNGHIFRQEKQQLII